MSGRSKLSHGTKLRQVIETVCSVHGDPEQYVSSTQLTRERTTAMRYIPHLGREGQGVVCVLSHRKDRFSYV